MIRTYKTQAEFLAAKKEMKKEKEMKPSEPPKLPGSAPSGAFARIASASEATRYSSPASATRTVMAGTSISPARRAKSISSKRWEVYSVPESCSVPSTGEPGARKKCSAEIEPGSC